MREWKKMGRLKKLEIYIAGGWIYRPIKLEDFDMKEFNLLEEVKVFCLEADDPTVEVLNLSDSLRVLSLVHNNISQASV